MTFGHNPPVPSPFPSRATERISLIPTLPPPPPKQKTAKIIAASKRMQTPSRVHRPRETISNLLLRRHKALGFHITNTDRSPEG